MVTRLWRIQCGGGDDALGGRGAHQVTIFILTIAIIAIIALIIAIITIIITIFIEWPIA